MLPILKNIFAVLIGLFVGSVVNMLIVNLNWTFFPIEGFNYSDPDEFQRVFPTLSNKYYMFPFLGHAAGTLVGAFLAALIAATHKMKFAFGIGALFLLGGAYMIQLVGGPIWYILLDLLIAYLPMAWVGGKLGKVLSRKS